MEEIPTAALVHRLIRVEQELAELRLGLLKLHGSELAKKNPGSLRGVWRGVVFVEKDFVEAKASLFPEKDI